MRLEFPLVVFELDAKTNIDAFYTINEDNSEFGITVKEYQFLCKQRPNFFVCFIRKEANKIAHKP